jgi:hypothetical protein
MQKQITRPSGENYQSHRSQLGREMEDRVLHQLLRMEQQGLVSSVRRHTNNEPEDQEGADFTVAVRCEETVKDLLFGVTISASRLKRSQRLHPDMRFLHIPASCNENQIYHRILLLITASVNRGERSRGRNNSVLKRVTRKTIYKK